jgi:hypothetical protein
MILSRKVFIILSFFTCISTFSQVNQLWFQSYSSPYNNEDTPQDMKLDHQDNIIVTGQSRVTATQSEFATVSYKPQGELNWIRRYSYGHPKSIVIDASNSIYIAGTKSLTLLDGQPVILKYSGNGNLLWTYISNGTGIYNDITIDSTGNVVAVGYRNDSLLLTKLSPAGINLWTSTFFYSGKTQTSGDMIALGSLGNWYVTGETNTTQMFSTDALLLKFNSNGQLQWSSIFNSPWNRDDYWSGIAVDAFENIYVTGTSDSLVNKSHTSKYNSQGTLIWNSYIYSGVLTNLKLDYSNNIYVSGSIIFNAVTKGNGIIKYDNSGNLLWYRLQNTQLPFIIQNGDLNIDNSSNVYFSVNYLSNNSAYSFSQIVKYSSNSDSILSVRVFGYPHSQTNLGFPIVRIDRTNHIYLATTGLGEYYTNDFHTFKFAQGNYTISGHVTFQNNGLPVDSGYVKALYYDATSAQIVTLDSTRILAGGSYILSHIPQDTLDIMFYQNDDELAFVPTYFVSTTDWRMATKIYATGNLTNVNGQVYRITNPGGTFSISGSATANSYGDTQSPLRDAVIYVQSGSAFKNYGISNSGGNYVADKLPAGSYTLTACRMGYAPITQNATITNSSITGMNFNFGDPIGVQQLSTEVPAGFSLGQNYPNPFNPSTTIKFDIPKSENVKITIYDITGRIVNILVNKELKAGSYSVNWDASMYASGVYFYRIETKDFTQTKKMLLIK